MKIAVVILAGGEGSRIGGNKPLRMLGGKSLLDRALDYAGGLSELSAVAVREAAQVGFGDFVTVQDDAMAEGPLGGLVSALHFGRREGVDAVLAIPADMPFLPPDLADRLSEAFHRSRVALASSGGHLHPVCGLWSVESLEALPDYLASGRRSLKGFAEAAGFVTVDWKADPVDPFFNINSERDLRQAERLLVVGRLDD